MDQDTIPTPRRWPLWLAFALSLLWLVSAIAMFVLTQMGAAATGKVGVNLQLFIEIAGFALVFAAPLAVVFLVAVRLRERSGARAAGAALLAHSIDNSDFRLAEAEAALARLDAGVTQLNSRIGATGAELAAQADRLSAMRDSWDASAERLGAASGVAAEAAIRLADATPQAVTDAERLTQMLAGAAEDLQRMIAATDANAGQVRALVTETAAAMQEHGATARDGIAALGDASARTAEALQTPVRLLGEAVDAAFNRTSQAMDATRDSVHAQTSGLLASVEQARVTLDQIGGEAARQIGRRLDTLLKAAADLGKQLEAQQERSRGLVEQVERGFGVLDTRLGQSVDTGNAALDAIAQRMTLARDAIYQFGGPLGEHRAAVDDIQQRLTALTATAGQALGRIETALPALVPQVTELAGQLDAVHVRAQSLAEPLAAGQDSLESTNGRLAETRAALEAVTARLAGELDTARGMLGEIEARTASASLTASQQLLDVFERVRDIAGQTTGVMRSALEQVVSEAATALDKAGATHAETAFGAPVRAHLADLEAGTARAADAAQAAAERITQRLVGLTATVAAVEARIDEADAHFDIRQRDDIAKRAAPIIESLKDVAADMARLLSIDISDDDWAQYLKGDKSVFARRMTGKLDGSLTRSIAGHFEHDESFRLQACRYLGEFEALLQRAQPDREGKSLAVTLLSSDLGKLYVGLAQATERLR